MANQNLSQFGENTSVSDADYTFVWDSAASISKKVSRNSWLTSPSLSSSAPVTISQTWGTTGTFTAFKVVATETLGANANSNLLELWSGSTAALKLSVGKGGSIFSKVGVITPSGTANAAGLSLELFFTGCGLGIDNNGSIQFLVNGTAKTRCGLGVVVASDQAIAWSSTTHTGLNVASDTILLRDSASGNTLALRNGALPQTFRVYGAYPDTGINYARLALSCDTSGNATISTQALGTYTAGTVSINGVPVGLGKGNDAISVAIGISALESNTLGVGNVSIGAQSLQANTSGAGNMSAGHTAMSSNTNGNFNSAIGAYAMHLNTSGSYNSVLGNRSLFSNATGSNNTSIGYIAGRYIAGGATANALTNNSVYLGANTKAAASGETNQIVIGYDATGIGDNSVVLGNDSITKTALKGNVGIGTTSPSSKLQVTGGDVEIETVTSGIIMKAAGTSTRYRITLNAGGTALVFTAI